MRGGQDYSEDILEGRISRTILLLSIPVIVSNVFQILYNLVDAYWVGRLGPDAIAAITLGFPFIFLIWSIGIGISIGITSGVARLLGAGKRRSAGELASHGITLAILMTFIMMAIGFATLEGVVLGLDPAPGKNVHVRQESAFRLALRHQNLWRDRAVAKQHHRGGGHGLDGHWRSP